MKYRLDRLLGNINSSPTACFCPYSLEHPDGADGASHPDGHPRCCDNPLARRVEDGRLSWRVANRMARTQTIPPEILAEFN